MKPEIASCSFDNCNAETIESQRKELDALVCPKSYSKVRTFFSLAGAKSRGKHDDALEGAFPVLQTRQYAVHEAASGDEMDDESDFESELFPGASVADDKQNELEISDTEPDVEKEKFRKIRTPSSMTKAILADTRLSVRRILEKWVEAGNEVTLAEASINIIYFRKRRMFSQALQVCVLIFELYHIDFL